MIVCRVIGISLSYIVEFCRCRVRFLCICRVQTDLTRVMFIRAKLMMKKKTKEVKKATRKLSMWDTFRLTYYVHCTTYTFYFISYFWPPPRLYRLFSSYIHILFFSLSSSSSLLVSFLYHCFSLVLAQCTLFSLYLLFRNLNINRIFRLTLSHRRIRTDTLASRTHSCTAKMH